MSVKVLKFGAEWCPPCGTLSPIIEKLKSEMPDVEFEDVDIDSQYELAVEHGIDSVPTLIFFKDGERRGSMVGLYSVDKIRERLLEIMR